MSSSASSQHYSLKWNNHQTHVLSAFDALLQNEFLVDCTLVCEDTSVKAHKVVLSACSPYFQKIFTDNPCKHPVIVLKDVRGWEVNCIVDFMYKGETSVPEAQLTSLIKAAESLKVRGLTSSDSRLSVEPTNDHMRGYFDHKSNQSSPISLTNHDDRSSARPSSPAGHGSAGPPRRKQARPRRRSGDSIGNSSLDLSKADSPNTFRKSPKMDDEMAPENLSMKRPSSSPAINLVKTESLLESGGRTSAPVDNCSERDSSSEKGTPPTTDPFHPLDKPHFLGNGIGHHGIQEQEARVEALQALNFMAAGGGLPHFPPPPGHLPHLPPHGPHHLPPSMMGRPTSTPNTPTPSAYTGKQPPSLLFRRRRSLSGDSVPDSTEPDEPPLKRIISPAVFLAAAAAAARSAGAAVSQQQSPQTRGPTHGTSAGFCNICQKFVSNRTNHKYVHSQVKFRCKLCGYLYSRKDTLKDHIRGKHNTRFSTADLNSLVEVVPPASNGTASNAGSGETK